MQENYQPVVLRKILLSKGATREELEEELQKYNPESESQSMMNTVLTVLQREGNNMIRKDGKKFEINSFYELSPVEIQELVDACNKRIEEFETGNKNSDDKIRFFIALGPWSNWDHSLNNPPFRWGVNPSSASNVGVFNALRPGDVVYYYANKDNPTPFSKRGLFGVGKVTRKYDEDKERYWPDEKLKDEIIYKHRFEIESLKLVQSDSEMVPWVDGLPFTKGLNRIANEDTLKKLIDNTEKIWNIKLNDSTTDVFLSERDFENMVKAIPLVVEYNKNKLQSDQRIPKAEDIQLCARLQYYCALRIAELLKITPNDIDLENYEINIGNRNDPNSFTTTTIHPAIKNDLEKYLKDKNSDKILFPFTRQLLWSYYKKAGQFAELNLFKKQTEREIEGMSTSILRDSRGRHMLENGAGEGLTRLKLRYDNNDPLFKFDEHSLQNLKDWENEEYENTLNLIETGNYYIITQNEDSRYDDITGIQHAYDSDKPHYKNFVEETNFIVQTKIGKQTYFVGYGKVGTLEKSQGTNPYGNRTTGSSTP